MDWQIEGLQDFSNRVEEALTSVEFYLMLTVIIAAVAIAWVLARLVRSKVRLFNKEPDGESRLGLAKFAYGFGPLLWPLLTVMLLGISVPVSEVISGQSWLVQAVQGIAIVLLLFSIINHFVGNDAIVALIKWIGVPVALLYAVGLLDEVIAYLDATSFKLGNIDVSAYAALRTLVFGVILFWLGRVSNNTGQKVIRSQKTIDTGTQEVLAKVLEIAIFVGVFLILVNIMGIDLTALAVFGGALGVGLGFGLQQIASNFISGLIILLDRSVTVGDYIELEDGRSGTLRNLTMRSATLETFEGKDIMVPNEKFITTSFVNWTHNNKKQRYSIYFQVAYSTDLEKLFPIVRDIVASHPTVLSGDHIPIAERPDAEIESFDDSGITILVEFWMEGIDDGENRVGGDLKMMIWTALRENGIEIPFPQREVRILSDGAGKKKG